MSLQILSVLRPASHIILADSQVIILPALGIPCHPSHPMQLAGAQRRIKATDVFSRHVMLNNKQNRRVLLTNRHAVAYVAKVIPA